MTMVVSCSPKDSTAPGLGLHPSGRPMLASPAAAASEPFQNHTYYRVREPGYGGKLIVPVVPQSVGFHFVSALVIPDAHAEGGEALWVFGTVDPPLGGGPHGRTQIFAWASHDSELRHWNRTIALQLPPGYSAWNTDVAPAGGNGSYVMAIELQAPSSVVGVPFSTAFAVCDGCGSDLSGGWRLLDAGTHLFTKARYNACPTIRYVPTDATTTCSPCLIACRRETRSIQSSSVARTSAPVHGHRSRHHRGLSSRRIISPAASSIVPCRVRL